MKKPSKLPKPKLPEMTVKRPFQRASTEEKTPEEVVPRITNETVSDHREEVLSSARRFIYPLQHSKHSVVRISVSLLLVVIIAFFVVVGLGLYKFQSTSGFTYDVTRIIPFPVAKAGSRWVSYESYLFELRRNMHYYQTQQQATFKTKDGKAQLHRLKQQALNQAIQDAFTKQLALQHTVTVSDTAVDNQVALVRSENRLGNSDRVFRDVLNQFWGWNVADFKRELKQELLQQAVVSNLDDGTHARASSALKQLQGGADFGKLATQVSDDNVTKATAGQYPTALTINDHQLSPIATQELFKLKPGQTSGVVNTGYTLEILKVIDATSTSRHGAHIQFTFEDISTYIKPLQTKESTHTYIKV